MPTTPLRILLASTPVGPLGSGLGGGVELTLRNLARGLCGLGHGVEVVAPQGSSPDGFEVHQTPGALHASIQSLGRHAHGAPPRDSVLAAMWRFVAASQERFDIVVNLAYDALPFQLAPALAIPVAHLVSMGSLTDAMDGCIARAAPGSVAVHSRAQAETFGQAGAGFAVVGGGVAVERYTFRAGHDGTLGFVGRIAPEKGLEDALDIAERAGKKLKVWGLMQDHGYWRRTCARHPRAQVSYQGFLSTDALQRELGSCQAVLMTPKWVEAFGNVAIEAMACGVPVIAYRRGGPGEIVADGVTGFVVAPDDPAAAAGAVGRLDSIARLDCRMRVEGEYSTLAFAGRVEAWLDGMVGATARERIRRNAGGGPT